jgi:ferredoxin
MGYLATIDEGSCIAQGDCQDLAPESFAVERAARFLGAGDDDLLLAAARACPVTAITIVDADTGEQVFP